jgi:hypothetical protein
MLTTTMKYVAVVVLIVSLFWYLPTNLRSYLDFVITAAAVFALVQAVNLRKYAWGAAFVAVACVFNPIHPIGFSSAVQVALQVISAAIFAVSLQALRTSPRMTIASITGANPRTESL